MTQLEDFVFKADSYVDFLHFALSGTENRLARKPRGSLQKLAVHLGVHPSFLAQVLSERAQMSVDQILLCAQYFELSERGRDQLLDLLLLDRSGHASSKSLFKKRIQDRLDVREDLAKRWDTSEGLDEIEGWRFYSSWILQATLSLLQIPRYRSTAALAKALNLSELEVRDAVKELTDLRLVQLKKDVITPTTRFLHLNQGSRAIRTHHQSWRTLALGFHSRPGRLKGIHYSGAITISKKDEPKVRAEILAALDRIREIVVKSDSEESHALLIDFFGISNR